MVGEAAVVSGMVVFCFSSLYVEELQKNMTAKLNQEINPEVLYHR